MDKPTLTVEEVAMCTFHCESLRVYAKVIATGLDNIIHWTAEWLDKGGRLLGKPTHYESRDGKY